MLTNSQLILNGFKDWNSSTVTTQVGSELEERTRFDEARIFLNRAIELDPENTPRAYLSLAFTHFRDITSTAETGEEQLVNGIEHTNSDLLKAWHIAFVEEDNIAKEMIEILSPSQSLEVQLTLANSMLWRGDTEAAYQYCKKHSPALSINDIDVEAAKIYVGLMTWLSGKYPEINVLTDILPLAQEVVKLLPNSFSSHNARLMIFQTLQQWENVRDCAIDSLLFMPDNETLMLALAIAYEKLSCKDEAIMWYNRAIGAKNSYVRARIRLAKLLITLSQKDLAETIIREIPVANKNYKMGQIEAAYVLFELGKTKDALELFTNAYQHLQPYEKNAVDANPNSKRIIDHNPLIITI